ncbi:MAG: hypothetical protein HZA66_17550 [Rhodopseudomonas palustris]|uniref:Uncharacterized protein n=1 Tax=Rhodopseudomonas palustris TaxID=1076 RepID=A0A933RZX0_RHOPL|nr:hypothetical protein [Rhodopseudomonas palustris]
MTHLPSLALTSTGSRAQPVARDANDGEPVMARDHRSQTLNIAAAIDATDSGLCKTDSELDDGVAIGNDVRFMIETRSQVGNGPNAPRRSRRLRGKCS